MLFFGKINYPNLLKISNYLKRWEIIILEQLKEKKKNLKNIKLIINFWIKCFLSLKYICLNALFLIKIFIPFLLF